MNVGESDAEHLANPGLRLAPYPQIANLPLAFLVAVKNGKIVHGRVFAKFKTLLRKAGTRSHEAISDACGEILAQYPPAECAAYLKNAGYA